MVLEKQVTVIMSLHELDLAQKISDQVICVHGDYIEKYGAPEEIFTSDYIIYDNSASSVSGSGRNQ